jgi:hypothetical protein
MLRYTTLHFLFTLTTAHRYRYKQKATQRGRDLCRLYIQSECTSVKYLLTNNTLQLRNFTRKFQATNFNFL